jgi:hypothetical protein
MGPIFVTKACCIRGHLFTPENTVLYFNKKKGKNVRGCRICRLEKQRKRRELSRDRDRAKLIEKAKNKEFCPKGHPLEALKYPILAGKRIYRVCRICQAERLPKWLESMERRRNDQKKEA